MTCFVASSFLKLVPVLEWELPWTDDRRYPTYNPRTMRLLSSCPSCSAMHFAHWLNAKCKMDKWDTQADARRTIHLLGTLKCIKNVKWIRYTIEVWRNISNLDLVTGGGSPSDIIHSQKCPRHTVNKDGGGSLVCRHQCHEKERCVKACCTERGHAIDFQSNHFL